MLKVLLVALSFSFSVHAAVQKVSLKEALENAKANNKEVQALGWQSKIMQLESARVKSEFAPKISLMAGVGPATKVTGNALSTVSDTGSWGGAVLSEIELTWPLWTWGRQDAYLEAVQNGVLVKDAEASEKWLEVRYRIRESYYGYLLAKTLEDFIAEGVGQVEESMSGMKKKTDRHYEAQILLSSVKQKLAEVRSGFSLAKAGLRVFGGYESEVAPEKDWLSAKKRELKPLAHYLELHSDHPKYQQIEQGLVAKRLLKKAENKAYIPALGLMAKYSYSRTNVREDQQSVFAYDPFNRDDAMVGVGFKWDMQWGATSAKVEKLSAEISQLEAQKVFAQQGLAGLVEKAWLELQAAEEKMKHAKSAQRAGKKWLARKAIRAGSFGRSDGVAKAFMARAQTKAEYLETVYAYELAWAELEKAVGVSLMGESGR